MGIKMGRGRPKKYWGEVIRQDIVHIQVTEDMTLDRGMEDCIRVEGQSGQNVIVHQLYYGCVVFAIDIFLCYCVLIFHYRTILWLIIIFMVDSTLFCVTILSLMCFPFVPRFATLEMRVFWKQTVYLPNIVIKSA